MADEATAKTPEEKPCQCGCGKWYCFLQSLATPGGNMFVLVFLLFMLLPTMIFLMVKFGPGAPVVITLVTITSGFAAALTTLMKNDGTARQAHAQAGSASAESK